jgi:hypothetical protein
MPAALDRHITKETTEPKNNIDTGNQRLFKLKKEVWWNNCKFSKVKSGAPMNAVTYCMHYSKSFAREIERFHRLHVQSFGFMEEEMILRDIGEVTRFITVVIYKPTKVTFAVAIAEASTCTSSQARATPAQVISASPLSTTILSARSQSSFLRAAHRHRAKCKL